jgi:Protein of unknown function (DUF3363)
VTWLDRQLVGREAAGLASAGFGAEVREAMNARVEHLVGLRDSRILPRLANGISDGHGL